MQRIISAALSLGAILALGVVLAGGAQAHTFLVTGVTPPALLLVLADGPQSFTAIPEGGKVTCTHARFHGTVTKESQLTQVIVGEYTGCTAFGSAATVTPAEYELNADETVSIINKTIRISVKVAKCSIDVAPQTLNKIRFLKDPSAPTTRILAHAEVEKITSTIQGEGTLCGTKGVHTEGEYQGLLLAWVEAGGSIQWV
jgi:hypothetical protein